MNSRDFYRAWLSVVGQTETVEKLRSVWRNTKDFTNEIIYEQDSILKRVSQEINLECYGADYYSLDSILYYKKDLVHNINQNSCWVKDIQVAFEHESKYDLKIFQEVAHLLITRCNLRVLVSYPENDKEPISDYIHEIISSCSIANEISEKENFLLILGYNNANPSWEGFVYSKDEKWIKINN